MCIVYLLEEIVCEFFLWVVQSEELIEDLVPDLLADLTILKVPYQVLI